MITCGDWPVAVCSWSLQTDVAGVAEAMKKLKLEHVNLAIGPTLEPGGDEYLAAVKQQDWTITSTMLDFPYEDYSSLESIKATGGITPDEHWEKSYLRFMGAALTTAKLGVKYLGMHAGFIDHSRPDYAQKFFDRIRKLADEAQKQGIMLLLETGQETAEELKGFLEELNHPAVGVNFDPANMILYDKGNPIEAVKILSPWIRHIHIKDANRTETPGTWGTEVPWGEGQVNAELFLDTLKEVGFSGAISIEREAGDDRFKDIKLAVDRLKAYNKKKGGKKEKKQEETIAEDLSDKAAEQS